MSCNLRKLWLYLNRELDLEAELEILDHMEHCKVCSEVLYLMARERDADLFVHFKSPGKFAG